MDGSDAALALLMSRSSPWPLGEPAPTPDQVALILSAALRAPDHGHLQPWRFAVVRGPAREALADVFERAGALREPEVADPSRFRAKALAAPLLIAMAAEVRSGHKVPESEQLLAAGAAAMNLLDAIHFLGYGGFWATGRVSHDERVREALGFTATQRLIGFLYVGTPAEAPPAAGAPRVAPAGFARDWPPSG
jgi:nitroreductase